MAKRRFVFVLALLFVMTDVWLAVIRETYLSPGGARLAAGDTWLIRFACDIWLPFLTLAAGAFLGLIRSRDDHAFRASQMFLWFSWMVISRPEAASGVGLAVTLLSSFAQVVAVPYLVLSFFLAYPSRSPIDVRAPWIRRATPWISIMLWLLLVLPSLGRLLGEHTVALLSSTLPSAQQGTGLNVFLFLFISAQYALSMSALGMSRAHAHAPDEKRRLGLIYLGVAAPTLSLLVLALSSQLAMQVPPSLVAGLVLLMGLFPVTFVYVVLRDRVFGIRLILRRGLQYALVSRGFLLLEGLLVFYVLFVGARRLIRVEGESAPFVPALAAALAVGVVFSLRRLTGRFLPWLDRRFFRAAYDARQVLLELSRSVRRLTAQPAELLRHLTRRIADSLHPAFVAVYLRDQRWPQLQPVAGAPAAGQGDDLWLAFASYRSTGGDAPLPAIPIEALGALLATGEPYAIPIPEAPHDGASAEACRLLVPLHGSGQLLGFLALGDKLSEEPFAPEDRELLLSVAEQAAIALENVQLVSQLVDQEKLQREVEIAQEVQAQLFPKRLPKLATLGYVGSCRSARAVGGDYYDFLSLAPGRVGIALGDIAGKGISAALLMASLQALLRSHAPLRGHDLPMLISDINRLLYESTDTARYATFFYGVYDEPARRLTYVNAGHVPPVLVRASGATGSVERLTCGGLVIGLMPDPAYECATVELGPGDFLLIFSDGVSEAESASGEMFGDERVGTLCAANPGLSAQAFHDLLLDEVARFSAGMPQGDDTTLIVAKGL